MARSVLNNLLVNLNQSTDPEAQVALLRRLKNELIGHRLRKEDSIRQGIVPTLAQIMISQYNSREKGSTLRDGRIRASQREALQSEELAFLHATATVTVLANGGPEFVQPILHSDILRTLLATLCQSGCTSTNTISILACLNAIADRLPPSGPSGWREDRQLAGLLYSPQFIPLFAKIISRSTESNLSQRASSLALSLMCKTCTEMNEKRALAGADVLAALATRCSSFIAADGYALPDSDTPAHLTSSTPPSAQLSSILEALNMLVEDSNSRARNLLSSPIIATVLPRHETDLSSIDLRRAGWSNLSSSPTNVRATAHSLVDALLPAIPPSLASVAIEQANFPPLGSVSATPKRRSSAISGVSESKQHNLSVTGKPEQDESPFVGWLLHLTRTKETYCRLMAAKLLISLYNLGFVGKYRRRVVGMLLVPMLVRMLEDDRSMQTQKEQNLEASILESRASLKVPAILSALIVDDEELQKSAVEAGAIKKLSQALKKTFDSLQAGALPMWTPERLDSTQSVYTPPEIKLGARGPGHALRQTMTYREGLLKALAAIAPFNDDYRKAICEHGVLPNIIDSLKPFSSFHSPAQGPNSSSSSLGNPAATLLAACSVTQALTRSVSALRTNLIDAGVAPPVLKLLSSGDPEIKIAATRVVGNLAMDFSPMKENISRQGVVRSLCEQAHSANARLRLESIWALKQLVLNSANSIKINVIQELGPNWMKQLISTDPLDIPPGVVIGLVDMEFPTRTQYLTDPSASANDVIMGEASSEGRNFKDVILDTNQLNESDDYDPNKHTIEDDTAIQEQLLDLIRNLFCGEKAFEIIEYIFSEMDQRDFFDIILTRLRYRTVQGATRKENKSLPPPTGIVVKVLYILVHMAASHSRFRNLISANTTLLRQIIVYCGHSSAEVRAQICWIAINLTYEDEPSDRGACKRRAGELQKAGYLSKLMAMAGDVNLDVRERNKTAIHLMRQSLA